MPKRLESISYDPQFLQLSEYRTSGLGELLKEHFVPAKPDRLHDDMFDSKQARSPRVTLLSKGHLKGFQTNCMRQLKYIFGI